MRIKPFYFLLLALLLFSCKSIPSNRLDWDRTKFKEKDGKLFDAVRYGTTTDVVTALKGGPDINVADYLGQTAFMWACKNGNLDIINTLLAHDETNRRGKKKYKRLNIKATSKMSNPELNYNALFCYIMSNPSNYATQNTLTRIINLDRTIMDMTDWYGETVIHKLVRSNNDYFDVVTKDMNKSKKNGLFNRKSNYGQSPLRLAVEFGNRWIIDALVDDDLVNENIVIDDINDENMPVYAFDQGNGDVGIFLSLFQGKMKYGKREKNEQFETAYTECDKGASDRMFKLNIGFFWEIYNNYLNEDIKEPKDIAPKGYVNRVDEIFKMVQRPMTDQDKRKFFDELKILPAALRETRKVKDVESTLLQMVIENQADDVFKSILERNISLYKIRPPNNGNGDYLTIAMLRRKPDIMRFLLDNYSDPNYFITDLMNPNTRIASEIAEKTFVGRGDLMDPLMLFCTDKDLSGDRELLRKMARFYQSKYRDNDNYCAKLLSELEKNKQFPIYKFFLDNYSESFYRVDKLNGEPVIKILLNKDNDQRGIVQNYIRYNRHRELDLENERALRGDKELWDEYNSLKTPSVPVQGRGR